MLRKLFIFTAIVLISNSLILAQSGTLKGKITDKDTKEAIPFASIIIEAGGKQYGGVNTDFDGNYTIKPIPTGKYDVKAVYVGFKPIQITDVVINSDKITFLDVAMEQTVQTLKTFEVKEYEVPLISKDQTQTGGTMTSEEMSKMPGRSASSVAVTVGGVYQDESGSVGIRGQRTEGTSTYIDGVRVRGSQSLPQSAIEEVTVVTGGLPAQYGDATGGIVNITTKGPSREFGAGVELVSSQFLDAFGYNLFGFNVQGPLIMGKDTNSESSLLGYFISGELSRDKDYDPSSIGTWKVNDDLLSKLEKEPLRPSGTGFGSYLNSEFITKSDLEKMKAKQNSLNQGINLSGKIDVKTTNTTNLTFGGSLDYSNYRAWQYGYSLLNNKNNPMVTSNSWRVFGRFTQRFPAEKDSKSLIKNVYYSIQADYSKDYSLVQDADHKDNLFDYGYVGKFKTYKIKAYEYGSDTTLGYNNIMVQNGFQDTLFSFEKSDINPDLSNYTQQYYDMYPESRYHMNKEGVQAGSGGYALLNGEQPDAIYNLWANTGTKYDAYQVSNASQIGINANGSADIKNHAIQFGLQYEQRIDRYYGYSPVELWTRMRQLTNKHIEQLDRTNPHQVLDANGVFQDTVNYDRLLDLGSQSFFDYNLRNKLNLNPSGLDWIDIDNLEPSTFSIDMFSADELLNDGRSLVGYYGYDYKGNKLKNKPSFEDFFTAKDEYGNYKREIGAFEPIYMSGYIQDKFSFNDLIFNIGVRVDRYDANQKVLKDPFSLYETKTVAEVSTLGGNAISHPTSVGSDYVVYVNDLKNPTAVKGYRNGSTWYNAEGTVISDPAALETPSGIAPCLVDPNSTEIKASAFTDYTPQTNIMPRISFSFPISDVALFFAHYDVLTKRPTEGTRFDPTDYLFIQNVNNIISNPNLLPEKTIDYELGFQQKISNSSSLKFSAYYRELRNLVQIYKFVEAYPRSYTSYNNIDFGTVKGATVSYDLRRTTNVWLKASYTLQFADGTGSSATSGLNLVNSGQPNLRTTIPLDFDSRHVINCVVDYRYSEGKKYNGPVWTRKIKGTDKVKTIALLQNTGINFTVSGISGTPYSKSSKVVASALGSSNVVLQGSINGSRKPWQFKIDARIDKDVLLQFGKKDSKKRKEAYLNIYLQVLNVLNTKNITYVYAATGNANDDGYLAAAEYQSAINAQINPQSYRDLYSLIVNNPNNYSLPRRLRLGVSLSF
ncbi:MAG: TonB-dependent receptor plug domain-containing protein [Bacteroidetes bacterium]|nr:TonB-dependent receptor plug domain-containing protein [Bacteroidota bacterium]